jgi:CRP-like cAMP-binding protein
MSRTAGPGQWAVKAGQDIFHEGQPGDTLYLVKSGRVLIWRGPAGNKVEINTIPAGGIFGEMAIFDGRPRMASATALEDTVLLRIEGEAVRIAMRKADPVLGKLIHIVLESARSLGRQVESLHRRAQRAEALIEEYDDDSAGVGDGAGAPVPDTARAAGDRPR